MTTKSGIYKIICKQSGHYYYGSAVNIKKRWATHLNDLKNNNHDNPIVQAVYNKYQTLDIEVVKLVPRDKLLLVENRYLKKFVGTPYCMNIAIDATAPMLGREAWNKGVEGSIRHSEESRAKISKNNARYWKGKRRPAISRKFKGHKVSAETKRKISATLKGRPLSDETRQKMKGRTPWNKGKKGVQVAWNKGLTKKDM